MSDALKPAMQRLFDAQSHWHTANEAYFEPNKFRISINSCIQELRNVTFVLQKNKSKIKGFDEWYEPWQQKMRANTSLRWLVDARNYIVKQGDLELKSILRVEVVGSYREDEVPFLEEDFNPNSSNKDIYSKIKNYNLPKEVFEKAYIKIERRWLDENYPDYELLELLTICWSAVAELLMDAPTIGLDQKKGQSHTALQPPCMYKGSETRSCWMKVVDEELIFSVINQKQIDLKDFSIEKIKNKYGDLPIFHSQQTVKTFKSLCELFFKNAMVVLKNDGYHVHLAMIFVNGEPAEIVEIINEDQADKYRTMRLIASKIEQIGADSFLMISEVWTAPFDQNYPYRGASESPDRKESLTLVGISKNGEGYLYAVPFTRENEKILYDTPFVSGVEGMNIIEPILSVWEKIKK